MRQFRLKPIEWRFKYYPLDRLGIRDAGGLVDAGFTVENVHDAINVDPEGVPKVAESKYYSSFVVYALINPFTLEVFYVGESENVARRFEQHKANPKALTKDVIAEFKRHGKEPAFVVLQRCESKKEAMAAERKWINFFKETGARITNG